jgi:AFG3 family protein
MDNNQDNKRDNNENRRDDSNNQGFNFTWVYLLIAAGLVGFWLYSTFSTSAQEIDWAKFESLAKKGEIEKVEVVNKSKAYVYLKKTTQPGPVSTNPNGPDTPAPTETKPLMPRTGEQPSFVFNADPIQAFLNQLDKLNVWMVNEKRPELVPVYKDDPIPGFVTSIILPLLLFAALWIFILRRVGGGAGGPGAQIFNIGKSKATLFDNNTKVNITFADVAGLDEAKEEVMEVVDFLKNPKKYTTLGGKIPKGVLLVGPPGTGKTLLAKAVAGEANAPFFSISGSDFVEMFVGVGASRVRDLFRQAREKAPCIIFIDEIDAIGRARGRGAVQGGNDERENTLNQLLVEMDGFPTDKGVILMAATNRPDILDQALLRPGRFDRQIGIDRPDLKGREQIFEVHVKTIKIGEGVRSSVLAEMTPGFVGADIANVCNEAALIAARRGKPAVDLDDFNYALDKVIGGLEKKNKIISPEEKQIIAYHEAGHAICGWYLEHAHPLVKVTIVPRGLAALGYAQYLPKEQYITREEKLLDDMCMTLGGRAAESVVFDKISTGAQSDLDQVTKMSYNMIINYGLNEKIGNISYYSMMNESYVRPYSDQTAWLIDQEVKNMIDRQYQRAKGLLRERRRELDLLAAALLDKEVLHRSDLEEIIGKRPFEDATPGESGRIAESN